MTGDARDRVRDALDALKPYLAAFVDQAIASAPGTRQPARADTAGLLAAVVEHWERVFSSRLPHVARSWVFELRDARNRWAHEEPFTGDEARRVEDTAHLLARAIGAPVATRRADAAPAEPVPRSLVRRVRQVDVMRELYHRHRGDEERVIREYAAAEERGEVTRRSNKHGLSAEQYARALLADGQRKGWLSGDNPER